MLRFDSVSALHLLDRASFKIQRRRHLCGAAQCGDEGCERVHVRESTECTLRKQDLKVHEVQYPRLMTGGDRLRLLARLTKLGDLASLAVEAGVQKGTTQQQAKRGSVSVKTAPLYIAAAAKHGVVVSSEWLLYGRGQPPKPPPENFVPRSVRKLTRDGTMGSTDNDDAFRVPLWQINVIGREAGAAVPGLVETTESVSANPALREFPRSFAVRMWDSSNAPYIPRGTLLYVERPHDGSPGQLCLFAHRHTDEEVIRPVVGILEVEDQASWHILQGTTKDALPKSQYLVCWRIRITRRD